MRNDAELTESLVPVFSSSNHDAEMESLTVRGILEASGIPAIVVGPGVLPIVEFQVQVPEHLLLRAQEEIAAALAAGPPAAAEAEAESECAGVKPPEP